MEIGVEERRLAIEIISTPVHIKSTMAELILKPAGIPPGVYYTLLHKRDESTGKEMSKRQIAPLIPDAIENRFDCKGAIRRIIEVAAQWTNTIFQFKCVINYCRDEVTSSLRFMNFM